MFCPKCATQNVEGASFCRVCGANISLVPRALTGQLPVANREEPDYRQLRRKGHREPTIEEAIRKLMMGLAFIVVSILVGRYSPGGWTWWYWLLIPAFTFLGKSVSDFVRLRRAKVLPQSSAQPQLNTVRLQELPVPKTGELRSPLPSVTEGTTRHLNSEPPTRHFNSFDGQKPS